MFFNIFEVFGGFFSVNIEKNRTQNAASFETSLLKKNDASKYYIISLAILVIVTDILLLIAYINMFSLAD